MAVVTEHTCVFIPGQAIAWGPEPAPFMITLALARRCGWGNEVHYRLYAWALDAGIVRGRIDDEPPPWDNLMALTPPSRRLEAAKARGANLGRPTVWTPQRAGAATVTQVAQALGVSRATIYRHANP